MPLITQTAKRFFRSAVSKLRWLFIFRRPEFIEFDFVDIVIADKPLLLIIWNLKAGYKIRVKALRLTMHGKSGARVITLSNRPTTLTIEAHNFWRRIKKRIELRYLELNDESADWLMKDLREPSKLKVNTIIPRMRKMISHTRYARRSLHIKTPIVKYRCVFRIKSNQFIFK